MAGWYAEQGCDEFYQALWKDECLSSALRSELGESVELMREIAL